MTQTDAFHALAELAAFAGLPAAQTVAALLVALLLLFAVLAAIVRLFER